MPLIEIPEYSLQPVPEGSHKDYHYSLYDLPEDEYQLIYTQGLDCFFNPFFNDSTYMLKYVKRSRFGGSTHDERFIRVDLENGEGTFILDFSVRHPVTDAVITSMWFAVPLVFDMGNKNKLHFAINHYKLEASDKELNMATYAQCAYLEAAIDGSLTEGDSTIKALEERIEKDLENGVPMPFPALHRYISNRLNMLIEQLGVLHVNDYYSFEVRPKGIKAKKGGGITAKRKAKAKQKQGSKIIFLNKVNPNWIGRDDNGNEVPVEREGHRRRGTRWTMKADKYRHHHNYLKPKANYRKSSWVGPENFEYEGNRYKILLQEKENQSS